MRIAKLFKQTDMTTTRRSRSVTQSFTPNRIGIRLFETASAHCSLSHPLLGQSTEPKQAEQAGNAQRTRKTTSLWNSRKSGRNRSNSTVRPNFNGCPMAQACFSFVLSFVISLTSRSCPDSSPFSSSPATTIKQTREAQTLFTATIDKDFINTRTKTSSETSDSFEQAREQKRTISFPL